MSDYDMYDSLTHLEFKKCYDDNKRLEKEVLLWKSRAFKARKFCPMEFEW